MTEVTTTLRSAYLAGPMRGYEEYNFPEFHKQAAWLRGNGWTIFSPAERDEADETIDASKDQAGWADHLGLDYFMQFDLAAVCTHDAVILLEGWEGSQGARLEAMVAVEIGHPVFEIVLVGPQQAPLRRLEHVEPNRIAAEFIAASRGSEGLPVLSWEIQDAPEITREIPDTVFQGDALTGTVLAVEADGTVRETTDEEAADAVAAMRAFDTGATRNVEVDPDIYGFTSPLALGLFAQYMHENRTQADGTIRASDNWKKGIPPDSYMRSMRRHLQDLTLHHDGYGHLSREDIVAAMCGLFFNVQGYIHEWVKAQDAAEQEKSSIEADLLAYLFGEGS